MLEDQLPTIVRTGKEYDTTLGRIKVVEQHFSFVPVKEIHAPFKKLPNNYLAPRTVLLPTIIVCRYGRNVSIVFSFLGIHLGVRIEHEITVMNVR